MKGEIKLLKAIIARLEGDSVAHEAELTIGRGEPVWGSQETIRESVRVEAAKRINGGVTPSPPLTANDGASSSSGKKQVAFDESMDGFVEISKKRNRGRKANRHRRDRVADQVAATTPAHIPQTVQTSSPPTGAVMYSRVAAAPPPPRVPFATCNMCTCSGNGTQERAVQDLLCLVDLYLVYLI